jgi:putative ABC transport system permease protein
MNISHIFKAACRALRSDLKNTLINVAGLSGGLTVFILIVLYVYSQYAYNTHIPHADQVFRLERGFHGITNAAEAVPLSSAIPEINGYCRIAPLYGTLFYRPGGGVLPGRADVKGIAADPDFLHMFAVEMIGEPAKALSGSPSTVLISRELSEKLFSNTDPMGEPVSFEGRQDLVVGGVFEPLPPESTLDFDVIFSINYFAMESGNPHYLENRGMWRYETFFMLDPANRDAVVEKIADRLYELYEGQDNASFRENLVVSLRPLKDIYFAGIAGYHKLGDRKNTYIFMIIAGFVLLIAAINFINLTTAQSAKRSRETGLRKILGADRAGLVMQICAEGAITILVSVIIATGISELLLPWYSGFINTSLSLKYSALNFLVFIIIAPVFLVILSALFPAWYLSRVSPLSVLRKEMNTGRKGAGLRSMLTIFQFSISIFLIIGTLVVNKQLRFINSYDPGYETEGIIEVKMNDQIADNFDVFKQSGLSNPLVKGITRTNQPLYQAGNVWSVFHGDKNFTWPLLQVDESFAGVFGLDVIAGEDFSESMAHRANWVFLVNEAAADAMETDDILGETINNNEIVGMVRDFHTASLKADIRPVTIALSRSGARGFIYIRTEPGNPAKSVEFLKFKWDELVPDYPFEYQYLTDRLESAYDSEKRFGDLFTWFALASILISCLGLFALSSFTTRNRLKEISIRKVHGATSLGMCLLLSSGLTGRVIIANLLAWPVAWYFARGWLENFVYRASPGPGDFLVAAIIAQVIALTTVSWQVYTTARKNPAETLKYE